MALSSSTTWEVRTTGNDNNGGAFVTGSSGTDYSQQDAAQYTFADLASANGTTNPSTITSVGHSFVAADVGNIIQISAAGTNFTTGFYQIVSVATGAATLDRACGTAASCSGGTYAVGGALATPLKVSSGAAGGHAVWFKDPGTGYSISSTVTFTGSAGSSASKLIIQGYTNSRGDTGRATFKATAGSITMVGITNFEIVLKNLIFDGNGQTAIKALTYTPSGTATHLTNCLFKNFNNGVANNASSSRMKIYNCEFTSCSTTTIISNTTVSISRCWFHDNTITPITIANADVVLDCIFSNNTGATVDGIAMAGSTSDVLIRGCIFYGNGRYGLNDINSNLSQVENNIFVNNGNYGIPNINFTSGGVQILDGRYNNAFYNNNGSNLTTNQIQNYTLPINNNIILTANPFNNPTSNDFSLNNITGAGAACRATGLPGIMPGSLTIGYRDIGTAQHADTGPTGGYPNTQVREFQFGSVEGDRDDGIVGSVTGSPTTTSFTATGASLSSTDESGGWLYFTSGTLRNICRKISSYSYSSPTGTFNFSGAAGTTDAAWPTAPSVGDTFLVLGRGR